MRVFVLGTFGWCGYYVWWFWQLFTLARRDRFPKAAPSIALFIPIYRYLAIFWIFRDLEIRAKGRGVRGMWPVLGILLLWVSNQIVVGTLLIGPVGLTVFLTSSLLFAIVAASYQKMANRYLRTGSPLGQDSGVTLGEAIAAAIGFMVFVAVVALSSVETGAFRQVSAALPRAVTGQSNAPAPTPLHTAATPTPDATPSAPRPADAFRFTSESRDYIGQGKSESFGGSSAQFLVTPSSGQSVAIIIRTNSQTWTVELAAPQGQILAVGSYPNAQRAAFATGSAPGLSVSGDGRECNAVFGSFAVTQVVFDHKGKLWALEATFIQHCESPAAPALRGSIDYGAPTS